MGTKGSNLLLAGEQLPIQARDGTKPYSGNWKGGETWKLFESRSKRSVVPEQMLQKKNLIGGGVKGEVGGPQGGVPALTNSATCNNKGGKMTGAQTKKKDAQEACSVPNAPAVFVGPVLEKKTRSEAQDH